MLLWLISEQKSWSAFGSFSPLNGLSPCPPSPFHAEVFKIASVLTSEELKGPLSPAWDARLLLFYEPKLAWQSQAFQSEPVSSCLVSSQLSVLICPRFPRGYTGQPGWVGFSLILPQLEKAVHVPTAAPLSKLWKTGLYFSHNWHGLCLGQEPKTNYKEWPQPRELEKHLDNTVQKLFPRMRWHLKYVLGLCIFFIALELV